MAINFPQNPVSGQVYDFGDYRYTYDGVKWTSVIRYGLAAAKIQSETPPPNPEAGLMWYQPSTGLSFIWYEDEDSGQWVEENPSIGAEILAASAVVLDGEGTVQAYRNSKADREALAGRAVFESTADFATGISKDGVLSDATLLALVSSGTRARIPGDTEYVFLNAADKNSQGYTDGVDAFQIRSPLDVWACEKSAHPASAIEYRNSTVESYCETEIRIDPDEHNNLAATLNAVFTEFGDTPLRVTLKGVDSTISISEKIALTKNKIINLGGNYLKLDANVNDYVIALDPDGSIDGFLKIHNGSIDGNKTGGQTRRYDVETIDGTYGSIYEAHTNYTGFGILVYGLYDAIFEDLKIIDTEAWGIAPFLCNNVIARNIDFDQKLGLGLNGDGITAISCVRMYAIDCKGYTNDDLVAVSTSRATINGRQVFNPQSKRDMELLYARNIVPRKKSNTYWAYNAAGVYLSDGNKIFSVDIDCKGLYFWVHCARIANYWSNPPYNATNGTIDNLVVNCEATMVTNGNADILIESCNIHNATIESFANKDTSDVGVLSDSPAIEVKGTSTINRLLIPKFHYYNNATPTTINRFIKCGSNSEIKRIKVTGELDIPSGLESGTVLYNNESSNTTILDLVGLHVKYNTGQQYINAQNITDDFTNVAIGLCNATLREDLTVETNVTFGTESPQVVRVGGLVSLTGSININSSYSNGDLLFSGLPNWALPVSAQAKAAITGFKIGSNSQVPLVAVRSSGNIGTLSGYGGDLTDSTVWLSGVHWHCV